MAPQTTSQDRVLKLVKAHCADDEQEQQKHLSNVQNVVAEIKQPKSRWEILAQNFQTISEVHIAYTTFKSQDWFQDISEDIQSALEVLDNWCQSDFTGGLDFKLFNMLFEQTLQHLSAGEGLIINITTTSAHCTEIKSKLLEIREKELDPIYRQLILRSYEKLLKQSKAEKLESAASEETVLQHAAEHQPPAPPLPSSPVHSQSLPNQPKLKQPTSKEFNLEDELRLKLAEINQKRLEKEALSLMDESLGQALTPLQLSKSSEQTPAALELSTSPSMTSIFDELRQASAARPRPETTQAYDEKVDGIVKEHAKGRPKDPMQAALQDAMNQRRGAIIDDREDTTESSDSEEWSSADLDPDETDKSEVNQTCDKLKALRI